MKTLWRHRVMGFYSDIEFHAFSIALSINNRIYLPLSIILVTWLVPSIHESAQHLLYLALYWRSHCVICVVQLICAPNMRNVLYGCSIDIKSMNAILWTPELGTPHFYSRATAVIVWTDLCIEVDCTVHSTVHTKGVHSSWYHRFIHHLQLTLLSGW